MFKGRRKDAENKIQKRIIPFDGECFQQYQSTQALDTA